MTTTSTAPAPATKEAPAPVGTLHVFDPHPLNWLFITWNTMEEPIRTDHEGYITMALAESATWRDETTLEVKIRPGSNVRRSRLPAPPSPTPRQDWPARSRRRPPRMSPGTR